MRTLLFIIFCFFAAFCGNASNARASYLLTFTATGIISLDGDGSGAFGDTTFDGLVGQTLTTSTTFDFVPDAFSPSTAINLPGSATISVGQNKKTIPYVKIYAGKLADFDEVGFTWTGPGHGGSTLGVADIFEDNSKFLGNTSLIVPAIYSVTPKTFNFDFGINYFDPIDGVQDTFQANLQTISLAVTSEVSSVPLPSAFPLFSTAIIGFFGFAKWRFSRQ